MGWIQNMKCVISNTKDWIEYTKELVEYDFACEYADYLSTGIRPSNWNIKKENECKYFFEQKKHLSIPVNPTYLECDLKLTQSIKTNKTSTWTNTSAINPSLEFITETIDDVFADSTVRPKFRKPRKSTRK